MAGDRFSFGIKLDGTLWAWGFNVSGQLGLGDTGTRYTPTPVGTSQWLMVTNGWVSTTYGYTYGIKADHTLWRWGSVATSTPTQFGTASDWQTISTGCAGTTIATKLNGTLWGWGYNAYGQVGNNSTTSVSIPVQIGSNTDWISARTSFYHSAGFRANGTAYGWGNNSSGQVGDGTKANNRLVPTLAINVNAGPLLMVNLDPAVGGSVAGSGMLCFGVMGDCQEHYPLGQSVELTAYDNAGYVFDYWEVNGNSQQGNPITVTMNTGKTVTAKFTQYMGVSVSLNTSAMGSVVSGEAEPLIHCDDQPDSVCSHAYFFDTEVTLKAKRKPGHRFVRWEDHGVPFSEEKTITLEVQTPRQLTAVFEPDGFRLGSPVHEFTPYTLPITAILDHSLNGGYYGTRDNQIVAYNGAVANLEEACEPVQNGCLYGYRTAESDNDPENHLILPELNYTGGGDRSRLWYDDHSGYDYSMVGGTELYATEGGKLYRATSNPIVGNETWANFHAIYIDHGNGYFSWYLHCSSIEPTLEQEINQNGFAEVTKDQLVALSGNYPNFGYHLHFELQMDDGSGQFSMVDPYQYRMWEDAPQQ